MTKIVTVTEDEAMKMALEGNEIILGGVEVHVHFVRYHGDPGIVVEFLPPYGKDDVPDWMEDIDNRLAGLCRQTVMSSKTCGLLKIRGRPLTIMKTTQGRSCCASRSGTAGRTG